MNINTTTEYININNFSQNIMTISSDDSNPVLLIVHGGAGSPDRPLNTIVNLLNIIPLCVGTKKAAV